MPKSDKPVSSLTPQIAVQEDGKLSKLQQQFNKKVKQVEKLKKELSDREESITLTRKRINKELQPVINQIIEKRVELVKLFDQSYALPFFRKREREKLAFLISDIAFELVAEYGREDILELHDKYAKFSFEETISREAVEAKSIAQELFHDMFGFNLEPDDLDDFDSLQAKLDKEMDARDQEKQRRQKNRKTKAQLAKEANVKAELQNISKASRRVYMELAKQLHPDVAQDETDRTWKEEAMKRVTLAYHNDDFFELLRLQAEFTHERSQVLNQLPEDQLKYYIKILSDQIQELNMRLTEFMYGPDSDLYYNFGGTPKQIEKKFKEVKEDLNLELEQLKQEMRILKEDPQMIRLILK